MRSSKQGQQHQKQSYHKYYHVAKLNSPYGMLKANTKKVMQDIVDDETVTLEEFRLLAVFSGATLDCFFGWDDASKTATPLTTKHAIVKQLLYTDKKIRHMKAK